MILCSSRALWSASGILVVALAGGCDLPEQETDGEARGDAAVVAQRSVGAGTELVPGVGPLHARVPAVLSGRLAVRINDRRGGAARAGAWRQVWLRSDTGERYRLTLPSTFSPRPGERVIASGELSADGVLVVDSIESQAPDVFREDEPLIRPPMHHRVAILATADADIKEREALEFANASDGSLADFYDQAAREIDTFSADFFARYDIDYSDENCLWDNTYDITDAMVAAFEADGNNASDYDHIAVVVPKSCGADWSGAWADIGSIDDAGQLSFELLSMYKDDAFDPWYLAHELGHNLGMDHARSYDCGRALYDIERNCEVDEYGNYNDVMGWGEGVFFGTPHERFMGWIDAAQVVTADGSGTFNLQPSDGPRCGIQALRVPVPGESDTYFYFEFRRPRQTSPYAGTGEVGSKKRSEALLVTVSRDDGNMSANARLELDTSRYVGAEVGVVYDFGDVQVEMLAIGPTVARVKVTADGTGRHRDDAGDLVPDERDGTFGSTLCVPEPACDDCEPAPDDPPPGAGTGFRGLGGCRTADNASPTAASWWLFCLLVTVLLARRRQAERDGR